MTLLASLARWLMNAKEKRIPELSAATTHEEWKKALFSAKLAFDGDDLLDAVNSMVRHR